MNLRNRTSTDILFCDKARVPMFDFDSNCISAALFWKTYIDRMSFGLAEGTYNSTDLEHGPRSVVTAICYRE